MALRTSLLGLNPLRVLWLALGGLSPEVFVAQLRRDLRRVAARRKKRQ